MYENYFNAWKYDPTGNSTNTTYYYTTIPTKGNTDNVDEDNNIIEIALPGVAKIDINIEVRDANANANCNGASKLVIDVPESTFTIKEKLEYTLSNNIDIDSIKSKLDKGILTITYDVKPESKPKSIKID